MAIVKSYGYPGEVDAIGHAHIFRMAGRNHGVLSNTDWQVTPVDGQDRTVAISAGWGFGWGVVDESNGGDTVQLPIVASGTRYYTIIARRNWTTKTTTFTYVDSGATRVISANLKAQPGVEADQPLSIARVSAGVQVPEVWAVYSHRLEPPISINVATDIPSNQRVLQQLYAERMGSLKMWSGSAFHEIPDSGFYRQSAFREGAPATMSNIDWAPGLPAGTFTAPPSGRVVAHVQASMSNSAAGATMASFEMYRGEDATGLKVETASDVRALIARGSSNTASMSWILTGLLPMARHYVRFMSKVSGGGTGTYDERYIRIEPTL